MVNRGMKGFGCFLMVLLVGGLNSCCPPQQELKLAVINYLNHQAAATGTVYTIDEVRILNVKKFTCDSVNAYVRIYGNIETPSVTGKYISANPNKASQYTIIKAGNHYKVILVQQEK
jgi:hypothetical protein